MYICLIADNFPIFSFIPLYTLPKVPSPIACPLLHRRGLQLIPTPSATCTSESTAVPLITFSSTISIPFWSLDDVGDKSSVSLSLCDWGYSSWLMIINLNKNIIGP